MSAKELLALQHQVIRDVVKNNHLVIPIYPPNHPFYENPIYLPNGDKHSSVGKMPTRRAWQHTPFKLPHQITDDYLISEFTYETAHPDAPNDPSRKAKRLMNCAIVVSPTLLVIDIDTTDKKDGILQYERLQSDFPELPKISELFTHPFAVKSKADSYHIYFRKPANVKLRKQTNKYPNIDFIAGYLNDGGTKQTNAFVLLPPSLHRTGKRYGFVTEPFLLDFSAIPEMPVSLMRELKYNIQDYSADPYLSKNPTLNPSHGTIKYDQQHYIEKAIEYLSKHAEPSVEGEQGDNTLYRTVAHIKDFGISAPMAYRLFSEFYNHRCEPPWDDDELQQKIQNVYQYGVNPEGAKTAEYIFKEFNNGNSNSNSTNNNSTNNPYNESSEKTNETNENTVTQRASERQHPQTIYSNQSADDDDDDSDSESLVQNNAAISQSDAGYNGCRPIEIKQKSYAFSKILTEIRASASVEIEDDFEFGYTPASLSSIHKVEPDSEKLDWLQELEVKTTDDGYIILPTLTNAIMILENLPELHNVFRFNMFSQREVLYRPPPYLRKRNPEQYRNFNLLSGTPIQDIDFINLQVYLARYTFPNFIGTGVKFSKQVIIDAISEVCSMRPIHPPRDLLLQYMDTWDGVQRITTHNGTTGEKSSWLARYTGCENNFYTRELAHIMLLAPIFRLFHPAHKYDQIVILEGSEGIRKSSLCKALALHPSWFQESAFNVSDAKNVIEATSGKVIVEFGELMVMTKHSSDEMKKFLSNTIDTARASYDRKVSDVRRQFVCMGTTNKDEYLPADEANRRYYPLKVKWVDMETLDDLMPQLWGEAMHEYLNIRKLFNEQKKPIEKYELAVQGKQALRQLHNSKMERRVYNLKSRKFEEVLNIENKEAPLPDDIEIEQGVVALIAMDDLVTTVTGRSVAHADRKTQIEIGYIMRALGWRKRRLLRFNIRRHYWVRQPEGFADPQSLSDEYYRNINTDADKDSDIRNNNNNNDNSEG